MKHIILIAALIATPLIVRAQRTDSTQDAPSAAAAAAAAADAAFARARQLVVGGNGTAGRALVDSLVASSPPGTPAYAQALYWRASLAAAAADAERDYRQIIVDYPFSPRAGDALFALAQLELSRGDRTAAAAHLDRLLREHPDYADRGRAGITLGRILLDQNQLPQGCAVLARTRAGVPAASVELRNQIDYYLNRCTGVDTAAAAAVAAAPGTPAGSTSVKTRADSVKRAASAAGRTERDTAIAKSKPAFTVQVAAFRTRADAERLVAKLKKRGVTARVVGEAKPYRVQVGRFATRAAASAETGTLRAKKIAGFVTTAEPERR